MGYSRPVVMVKSERKGMVNVLQASRNMSLDAQNKYKRYIDRDDRGLRVRKNKWQFAVPSRMGTTHFVFQSGDADGLRDGNAMANAPTFVDAAADKGTRENPSIGTEIHDDEKQREDILFHSIRFQGGKRQTWDVTQFDQVFNTDPNDRSGWQVDGRNNMANELERDAFITMQRSAAIFIPPYAKAPGSSGSDDPQNSKGGITVWKFFEAQAIMEAHGNMQRGSQPYLFIPPAEKSLLDFSVIQNEIDRSMVGDVLMRSYKGSVRGFGLTTSNCMVATTNGRYGALTAGAGNRSGLGGAVGSEGVGGDWVVDADAGEDSDTITSKSEAETEDILDEGEITLRYKLGAGVALTLAEAQHLGRVFVPGMVLNISKTRGALTAAQSPDGVARTEADSNRQGGMALSATDIIYDVNDESRFDIEGVPQQFHVESCTLIRTDAGDGAATAIPAAGTIKVKLKVSPNPIYSGVWAKCSRQIKAGDKVSVISGSPGSRRAEACGWQREGFIRIYKNPLKTMDSSGRNLRDLTTYYEELPQTSGGAIVAGIQWSEGKNLVTTARKELWKAERSFHPWRTAVRIGGRRIGGLAA